MQRFDVVVWGATGFTGALVAEYLLRHEGAGGPLRWAIAGRSEAKLAALRSRLAALDPVAAKLPLLVADAGDPGGLHALARQARVVCTTVGPYARHGSGLVAACVDEGSHYCDLTGEVQWMQRMIEAHHERARAAGVRIVHACGFDSIPSDLGCFELEEQALARDGEPLPEVTGYVTKFRGGVSGGTAASLVAVMEEAAADPAVRRVLADPYALLPDAAPRGGAVTDTPGVARDAAEGVWTGPFVMAPTNAKVVRRSNALLGGRYGAGFRYREVQAFGGPLPALAQTLLLGALAAGLALAPTRRLLQRFALPASGEGPDAAARERGEFELQIVGRRPGSAGGSLRVVVHGDKDPGYGATAGMLAEAALCLAGDALPEHAGVSTPAAALGRALVARLPRAGVTFRTEAA